jgi:hypothetical protein
MGSSAEAMPDMLTVATQNANSPTEVNEIDSK